MVASLEVLLISDKSEFWMKWHSITSLDSLPTIIYSFHENKNHHKLVAKAASYSC